MNYSHLVRFQPIWLSNVFGWSDVLAFEMPQLDWWDVWLVLLRFSGCIHINIYNTCIHISASVNLSHYSSYQDQIWPSFKPRGGLWPTSIVRISVNKETIAITLTEKRSAFLVRDQWTMCTAKNIEYPMSYIHVRQRWIQTTPTSIASDLDQIYPSVKRCWLEITGG